MCMLPPTLEIGTKFWKGLVPEVALCVPYQEDIPNLWKDTVGMIEDNGLMRVARARAVVEREMGRRLAKLRDTDGLIKLGFVRLGDYARERLHLGCRTAQEMARVGTALEKLPVLRKANDEGRLNSSQVRLLVGVVTPENEARWVERAAGMSVRGLREAIRLGEQAGGDPDVKKEMDRKEEEARPMLRFQSPYWFSVKWDCGVDLFRKIEGRDNLPPGAAAEAFAADWQSDPGLSAPAVKGVWTPPGNVPRRKNTREQSSRSRIEQGIEEEYRMWEYLKENDPVKVKLPSWLDAYKTEIPVDPFVLDRKLRELEKTRRELDAMAGRMLCTMGRVGLFRMMQFLDLGHYARERMGMGRSTARRLRWVERWMFELPEVREAYYKGEIGIAKVVQLLRVRESSNQAEWLERAKQVTVRRLEKEVQLVLQRVALLESGLLTLPCGEDWYKPLPPGEDLVCSTSALKEVACKGPKEGLRTPGPWVTIQCAMDPETLELWKECVERCRALYGPMPEWECANRFLDSFLKEYERKDPLRYTLNHKVFARDGWQCTCPGCSNRGNLTSHHCVFRSQNGPDTEQNETGACTCHHFHGLHKGTIEVKGTAPDGLIWRLGVRKDGTALLTIGPGERILEERDSPPEPCGSRHYPEEGNERPLAEAHQAQPPVRPDLAISDTPEGA
jgi:hypothetical protein